MFGNKLRLLRDEKGLSQTTLAEAAGVSADAIQHYEDNTWRPGTGTISRLADALDVTVCDLVEECEAICDKNGDVILVEKNTGCRLKILGVVRNTVDKMPGDLSPGKA
jgi:transcriptional regulator with XRE-family HTH domain